MLVGRRTALLLPKFLRTVSSAPLDDGTLSGDRVVGRAQDLRPGQAAKHKETGEAQVGVEGFPVHSEDAYDKVAQTPWNRTLAERFKSKEIDMLKTSRTKQNPVEPVFTRTLPWETIRKTELSSHRHPLDVRVLAVC